LVAVVGRPNVGKSTLVNALVGAKVAIVSDKPQTTRFAVRGVRTEVGHQIVFTDTPGIHKPRTALGERLNARASDAADAVDVVLQVVDAGAGVGRGDAYVAERHVRGQAGAKVCAVNKMDLAPHHRLVPQLVAAAALADFDHVVPVSARTGRGLDELRAVLQDSLPEGSALFPPDEVTDQPTELRIGELIREQALAVTREEVPHSVAVVVEEMERVEERGLVRIDARIFVERESQRGILIGRGGATLKEIGTKARAEVEGMLGGPVYLGLRVSVLPGWQRDPAALTRLGL
jgi:GTP-binding protein Era